MKNRENRENGYLMLLMQNALFQGFTEEKIESTLKALKAQRKRFKRGVFVYHEGQRNVKAAIVLAGSLHIIKEDFWGNRSILAEVEKGDMFAETYSLASALWQMRTVSACSWIFSSLRTRRF